MTETAKDAARRLAAPMLNKGFKPEALHHYRNAAGEVLFSRIRLKHPTTREKWIRPMHLNGNGHVLGEPKIDGAKPIYNLHRLARSPGAPVFIVEGEKAADALTLAGVVATTSGGAESADRADWQPLKGRDCIIWRDRDEAGAKYAQDVAGILTPLGCSIFRLDVDALDLPEKGDAADWMAAHPKAKAADVLALPYLGGAGESAPTAQDAMLFDRGGAEVSQGQPEAIGLRFSDIESRPVQREKTSRGERIAVLSWPPALDLEVLAERAPSPPRAIMQGVPVGYATLIAGHGGAGKSAIALYLAACIGAGRAFFGLPVERRRVLFLSCEDREDVLHWRLSRVCAHLGIELASLRGWVQVLDLVGQDALLWRADPRTGAGVTVAYAELAERMREADVLMVDGINDTFAGSENDRGHVKAYVNALLALIAADRGALVLIGHVPKATANGFATEGYSGSTGWHNAARARWYLRPEAEDGGERTGAQLLEQQKANHGNAVSLRFTWDDVGHLFVGELVGGASHFDRAHQARTERAGILAAFKASAEATPPLIVPAATAGPRTTLHALSARPEFPDSLRSGRAAARRFWRHIEELRQFQHIEECGYLRANRHKAAQLVLTAEGLRQCAA